MTAMIDMHAHWRPAEVADALRARTREPRIIAAVLIGARPTGRLAQKNLAKRKR